MSTDDKTKSTADVEKEETPSDYEAPKSGADVKEESASAEYVAPPSIEDLKKDAESVAYEAPPSLEETETEASGYVAPRSILDDEGNVIEYEALSQAEVGATDAWTTFEEELDSTTDEEDGPMDTAGTDAMAAFGNRHATIESALRNFLGWFPAGRKFPEVSFNFIVLAGLDFLGEFKTVSGANYTHNPLELHEGGRNHSPHLLPYDKPSSRGELTLTWGAVSATSLYTWAESVEMGKEFRREVYVVQLSRDGWPTRIMRFGGVWPKKWEGASLDTDSSSWAVQSLTLVYDRFTMVTIPFDLGATMRGDGMG